MSSLSTSLPYATRLLCLNSLGGLLSISNNLYPVAQSVYRRNLSTETTLLKVTANEILLKMNKQHVTMVWMALPLLGSDLICVAVPTEPQLGELYLISLTSVMAFLKARA